MSIADKLTYLNTTKQLLKTEINKINNVLDDNSTFRSYPQELFNGYLDILNNGTDTLWNNLEKVSQTGTEAVLEGVETAPMKMVLNGNTSQDGEPTPDTPVEVKVVKGENVVSVQGKNLFDKDNETLIPVNSSGDKRYGLKIKAPNKYVSISGTFNTNIAYKKYSNGVYGDFINISRNTSVLVDDEIIIYNGGASNKLSDAVENLQIEISPTATPYVPFSKTDYPINLVSKNKLDLSKIVKGRLDNGIIGYESDTISLGTTNNKLTFATNTNYRGVTTDYIEIKNGDFIFFDWLSKNNDNLQVFVAYYDKDKNYISQTSGYSLTNAFRFSNNVENSKYIRVYISLTTAGEITIQEPQVEFASDVSEFEEYFNIELCKINTYKDYFHKDSGKWYVHKEIWKKILNGSENWADRQQGSATYLYLKCTLQNGANGGISDKFKYNQSYNVPEEHILVSNEWNEASIVIRKDRLSTPNVANFKSWLSNNNVTLYYVLVTPTDTEITNTTLIEQLEAISKAKSVKDKTYITQTNEELPFILDVEAIKEYEVN